MRNHFVVMGVLFGVVVSFVGVACSDESRCDSSPSEIIFFPEQQSQRDVMDAQLIGNLVLVDGLLRVEAVEALSGEESYLPLWPAGFRVCADEDGTFEVLNQSEAVVARIGEEVYMGGGETGRLEQANAFLKQPFPMVPEGPYWVVGDEVRLNLRHDSKLFDLDVFSDGDQTFFFIRSKSLLDSWVVDAWMVDSGIEEKTQLSGRVICSGRCLRLVCGSAGVDYTTLWPDDYSADVGHGVITVHDRDGQSIVRVGDDVTVEGYQIPVNWRFGRYPQLKSELPGDTNGPYFVVTDIISTPVLFKTPSDRID